MTQSVDLHGQIDGVDDPDIAVYELRVRTLPVTVEAPHETCRHSRLLYKWSRDTKAHT